MKNDHMLGMFAVFVSVSLLFTWFYVSGSNVNILGNFEIAILTKPLTAVMATTFVISLLFFAIVRIMRR